MLTARAKKNRRADLTRENKNRRADLLREKKNRRADLPRENKNRREDLPREKRGFRFRLVGRSRCPSDRQSKNTVDLVTPSPMPDSVTFLVKRSINGH